MRATNPHRAVSPPRMLLATACLLAMLAGVVIAAEALRHPPADAPGPPAPEGGDVRDEVVCDPRLPRPRGAPARAPIRVSSADLHDCPSVHDRRAVVYEGEAVGALLTRRDGAWLQLNDDAYGGVLTPLPAHRDFRGANSGVGVFLAGDLADLVDTVGGPRARGDVLWVTGSFHRVDPTSGEVAVIRADQAVVVSRGAPTDQPPLRARRIVGALLSLVAVGMAVVFRRGSRRWPGPSRT